MFKSNRVCKPNCSHRVPSERASYTHAGVLSMFLWLYVPRSCPARSSVCADTVRRTDNGRCSLYGHRPLYTYSIRTPPAHRPPLQGTAHTSWYRSGSTLRVTVSVAPKLQTAAFSVAEVCRSRRLDIDNEPLIKLILSIALQSGGEGLFAAVAWRINAAVCADRLAGTRCRQQSADMHRLCTP